MSERKPRTETHEITIQAMRAAHADYVEKTRQMHEAKDYRRRMIEAARSIMTLEEIGQSFGWKRKDVEAIVDGRD